MITSVGYIYTPRFLSVWQTPYKFETSLKILKRVVENYRLHILPSTPFRENVTFKDAIYAANRLQTSPVCKRATYQFTHEVLCCPAHAQACFLTTHTALLTRAFWLHVRLTNLKSSRPVNDLVKWITNRSKVWNPAITDTFYSCAIRELFWIVTPGLVQFCSYSNKIPSIAATPYHLYTIVTTTALLPA